MSAKFAFRELLKHRRRFGPFRVLQDPHKEAELERELKRKTADRLIDAGLIRKEAQRAG